MNFKIIFLSFSFFFSLLAAANVSAVRGANESFTQARARNSTDIIFNSNFAAQTAWGRAVEFEKVDFSEAADVGTIERLTEIFNYIRDSKFISNQAGPLPERRLSWLYPDDGCYIRAELAVQFTVKQQMPETAKLFGFGDLAVKSSNHPDGIVRWWYHVVPVYRVGTQAYVVDPSIDYRKPMLAEEWKKAMEAEYPAEKFSVCKAHTIGPDDSCTNPYGQSIDNLIREQTDFLNEEWYRVITLGRDPQSELGNNPPWK